MQQQRNSGARFQNRDSFNERMNYNMSIDRFSRRSLSPVLTHKVSLIDAMDLQMSDRKSDLYQNLLGEHRRSSNYRASSNISRNDIFSRISRESACKYPFTQEQEMKAHENDMAEQNYRQSGHKLIHECNCSVQQCNGEHCSCFLYPNELCVIGLCCPKCVKFKNEFLTQEKVIHATSGCLCKNIKCLKMYCSCYREGRKCNPSLCKCEDCENLTDGLIEKKKRKLEFQFRRDHVTHQRPNFQMGWKGNPQTVNPVNYSFVNCACKKSHCLKKYCSCYFHNKPCSEACGCEDCHNQFDEHDEQEEARRKARYARHDDDCPSLQAHDINEIDQFLQQTEEKYQGEELHQHMEFEPVNFQFNGP